MDSLRPDFFGWEMLYKSIEKAIIRKTDILVALTHFVMLKHGRFLCLGLGEEPTISPTEFGMELLPDGWNYDSEKYALRYIRAYEVHLLTGFKDENGLFVMKLLNVQNDASSTITLNAEKLVNKIRGTIKDLVPKASKIAELLRRELIDPVFPRSTNEMNTQTNLNEYQQGLDADEEGLLMEDLKVLSISSPMPSCETCQMQQNSVS